MADHSSERPTAPDAEQTRRDRRDDADAASFDAFAIPAPGGPALADEEPAERSRGRRHRVARTDWRLGGRTVRRWREGLLSVALIALAVALLAGVLVTWLWESPLAGVAATGLLWLGFAVVVIYAFRRSRPVGLLRFRALDLLYGLGLALVLRTVQGWVEMGDRGSAGFPTTALIDGRASAQTWVIDLVGALTIAPVLEEFFFRGVVLVAVFSMLRRRFGAPSAGIAAVLASSGLFVLVHALVASGDVSGTLALFLLGLVTSMLVVLTGRIWGAVLVHVGFNASYLALAAVGTALG